MQDTDIEKIAEIIVQKLENKFNGFENSSEFKELMKEKDTKTIRILSSVKVMLVKHCEDKLITPVQYASRAIIKEVFKDRKKTESKKK